MTPLQRATSMRKKFPAPDSTVSSMREEKDEGMIQAAIDKIRGTKTNRQVKFSALDESAKKAAPKLFFAGERTFLQWMHTGILLAGISMGLGSHTETGSIVDWISVLLLPVSIGMIVYAMFQCKWN